MNRGRRAPTPTWATYRGSIGDRSPLFAAVRRRWGSERALYPGCYLDLSPSTAIPSVTYVDTDRRAARYFEDPRLVAADLDGRAAPGAGAEVRFLHRDYTGPLPLPDAGFDLLVSLYAGPVWDHCLRFLAPGGLLLANTSHGDASVAALDPTLELVAAVHHRAGSFRLDTDDLGTYLHPRAGAGVDADAIRRSGRGIRYTRTAFAYLFRLGR